MPDNDTPAPERLAEELTRNAAATIIADIESGRAECLYPSRHGQGRHFYRVRIGRHWARVVYQPDIRKIITIMGNGKLIG